MTSFLANENIPIKTIENLRQKGFDIITILDISHGLSDSEVLAIANRQKRVIITFDADFGELVFKEKLKAKGIILLRFAPKSPQHIANKIEYLLKVGIPIENCFIVAKEDSVRVIPIT